MKLDDGRVPIEPLDDLRLSNIERRVVAGASEPTRRTAPRFQRGFAAMALALVVVISAGVGGWLLRGRSADVAGGGGEVATTTPLDVTTGAEGSTLRIGDATIESDPDTAFSITRPHGMVIVAMTRGRVELEVAKRTGRPPLIVRAGDTDVIVVGTHFTVDFRDGTGDVLVNVTEGVVRVVRRRAPAVPIAAGQAWTSTRGVIASAELATVGDVAATVGAPGYDLAIGDAPDVLKPRVAVVPDTRVPGDRVPRRHSTAPGGPIEPAPRPGASGNDDAEGSATPPVNLVAMVARQRVEPALDVGTVDGTRAMAKYRELLTTEKGKVAAHAFYSMAVTQHLKLGRNADALSTIDALLRRFTDSDYHTAAMWLRVRIACATTIDARCQAAAVGYLRRTSTGVAASVAELITLSP